MHNYLLDVNVMLAIVMPSHECHVVSREWFRRLSGCWFSCALTQASLVRLLLNPSIAGEQMTMSAALRLLKQLTDDPAHDFVAQLPAITDKSLFPTLQQIRGYRQVSDLYLIALANTLELEFVTLDKRLRDMTPRPILLNSTSLT